LKEAKEELNVNLRDKKRAEKQLKDKLGELEEYRMVKSQL
jgi:hypothetical protein